MIDISGWALLSTGLKLLGYVAMVAICGGWMNRGFECRWGLKTQSALRNYYRSFAVLGAVVSFLYFFIQVGSLNEMGLAGIFDWSLIRLLALSTLGAATVIKLLFFMLAYLVIPGLRSAYVLMLPVFVSMILTGHVSALNGWLQLTLLLHLLTISFWLGGLYPLYVATRNESIHTASGYLIWFGKRMVPVLLILATSGSTMLLQLIDSWPIIPLSLYQQLVLGKLFMLVLMLALGAWHKFRLVPALSHGQGREHLLRSLRIEMAIALLLLTFTAAMTTLTGPG